MQGSRWRTGLRGRAALTAALALAAIRFVGATVSAYLGIQGLDTRTLDAVFEAFSVGLVALLIGMFVAHLPERFPHMQRNPAALLLVALLAATAVQWVIVVLPPDWGVSPPLGPWTDWLLGLTATATLASLVMYLERGLRAETVTSARHTAFLAVGLGFAGAYFLRTMRLLDYTYVFGMTLPSGVTWLLDFGPTLLLSALACLVWASHLGFQGRRGAELVWDWLPPIAVAAGAYAAAVGVLGGFILANALAWGGSYVVFSPTTVSLPFVGFGIGAFVSLAWSRRTRMPGPAWMPAFGGTALAALAGIQIGAGILPSLLGLLTAVLLIARGLALEPTLRRL